MEAFDSATLSYFVSIEEWFYMLIEGARLEVESFIQSIQFAGLRVKGKLRRGAECPSFLTPVDPTSASPRSLFDLAPCKTCQSCFKIWPQGALLRKLRLLHFIQRRPVSSVLVIGDSVLERNRPA